MLGFMRPKSARKRSVLAKQRVSAGSRGADRGGHAWSLAAKCLLGVLLLVLVWGLGLRLINKVTDLNAYFTSLMIMSPKEWRVEVVNSSGSQLPDDIRREVYKLALKSLRTGSQNELRTLAKQVESIGSLEAVRVIRPLTDTVILTAEIRRPTLLIEVGPKTRFLTSDGTVFGDVSEPLPQSASVRPTVKVTGIFDQRPNPSLDSSHRVITNTDERRHLQDTLEIWSIVSEGSIKIKSINFQKFRGYALVLDDDTEIVIGLKPFAYKLKKLNEILAGLARDGIVASRIELDYEGKAFIKERRL